MLEKSGVEKTPETIDEFVDALKKVQKTYPNSTPYSMMTKSNGLIVSDFQLWFVGTRWCDFR